VFSESVRDCTLNPLFYRGFYRARLSQTVAVRYNPEHVIGNALGNREKDDGSRDQPTKRQKVKLRQLI
jgi:hypothetical protein